MVNELHRKKQFLQVLKGLTTSRVHVLKSPKVIWKSYRVPKEFQYLEMTGTTEYPAPPRILYMRPTKGSLKQILYSFQIRKMNSLNPTGIQKLTLTIAPNFYNPRYNFNFSDPVLFLVNLGL